MYVQDNLKNYKYRFILPIPISLYLVLLKTHDHKYIVYKHHAKKNGDTIERYRCIHAIITLKTNLIEVLDTFFYFLGNSGKIIR